MNTFCRYLLEFSHWKSLEIGMLLYYKNKTSGDMRKKPQGSNFVKIIKIRNTKMIQMNQMQLTSQTPSPTEITKTLSTSQPESGIIDY